MKSVVAMYIAQQGGKLMNGELPFHKEMAAGETHNYLKAPNTPGMKEGAEIDFSYGR